jgi:N utilization substance protein B
MISRRILRIKILQLLYANFQSAESSLVKSEKELFFSIQKTYDLYHYLLLLILDIADYAGSRIELARQKRIPTRDDLNPNTKFVDNHIIQQIRANKQLNQYLNHTRLSWVNTPELIKKMHNRIRMAPFFKEYMEDPERSYEKDKNLIIDIFNREIINSENLYQTLEEQSIYWNDEVEFVLSMIAKTLKLFKEKDGENAVLMPLFKNEEDEEFVKILFRKAILNQQKSSEIIDKNTTNWEVERIALMDILVMQLAITEIIEFPEIPIKVTLNEYIEIAKYYCTSKSSNFVNGILDNIVKEIREEGLLNKSGRGLVGGND